MTDEYKEIFSWHLTIGKLHIEFTIDYWGRSRAINFNFTGGLDRDIQDMIKPVMEV